MTGDPAADDVVFSGTFAAAAVLPGLDAPFDLGDAEVKLDWPDVNQPNNVQVTATTSAGQDLINFLNGHADDIAGGLSGTATLLDATSAFDVLATKLPIVNKSIGDVLHTQPVELTLAGSEIQSVGAVTTDSAFKKFTVTVADGINLLKEAVNVGDVAKFRGLDGSQSVGQVDAVNAGSVVVRFPIVGVQPPDTAAPSLKVFRGGSLDAQFKSMLSNIATQSSSGGTVTFQDMLRTLSQQLGVQPDVLQPKMTGSDSDSSRAVQFTLPFDPDPQTYENHLDFSTSVPSLSFDASADLAVTVDSEFQVTVGLKLGSGINASDRFFLVQDDAPEITLDVTADLANPDVQGTLGFLGIRLADDPAIANNDGVHIDGHLTVNLTDPGTVANDGRIQIAEFTPANLGNIFSATIDAHFDMDGIQISAGAGLKRPAARIDRDFTGRRPAERPRSRRLAGQASEPAVRDRGDWCRELSRLQQHRPSTNPSIRRPDDRLARPISWHPHVFHAFAFGRSHHAGRPARLQANVGRSPAWSARDFVDVPSFGSAQQFGAWWPAPWDSILPSSTRPTIRCRRT